MATDMAWPPGVTRCRNGAARATSGMRRAESAKLRSSEMPAPRDTGAPASPPNNSCVFIFRWLLFDGVDQVGAAFLARLGLDRPAVVDGVTHLEGVDGFGERHAPAHVEPRRQVLAQHQRGTDLVAGRSIEIGFHADVRQ